ncbi:uncharacterized protein LOC119954822 [Scyliorhinus canicula]|uniref:uncharacterized protein LOC119954822 n=1 Tax=Scyliorhinus canicula TaxID=7830 RepID=UPI0018F79589|nr:uncharacterized protein LOC119954822 [Scyliorhinus canicula]
MGTNIGGALMKVLESINQTMQEKRTAGVPREIILLITDGRHNGGPSPPDVVQKIKETVKDPDRNLDIFTIGIGDASKEELEKLTTNKEEPHSYYFRSYNQLEELTELIQNRQSDHVGCGVRGQSRRTRSVGRIYGGENVEEKQWPWQVSMIMGYYAGGGSIISPTWILTAAHNMFDDAKLQLEPAHVKVHVGKSPLSLLLFAPRQARQWPISESHSQRGDSSPPPDCHREQESPRLHLRPGVKLDFVYCQPS